MADDSDLAHRLIPLALAVTVVRHRVYGTRQITDQGPLGDLNMLANFIACAVAIYEYFDDPSKPPRVLDRAALEGGIFREGGKEIHFLDGRPPKSLLAVTDADLQRATALLKDR